ncbi:Hypothetical predicted protein [Mytilus galloprovincialis]|uniref:Mab-21-like HhH/H2TH-like domain-containing protein n=2 Tax=Mytilus galloprovincialis TaxID=29158 RepID=A0A8B6C4N7_MYTGA|nr:Hypothetical predicted protein [Mytilus galloprovincialis]
MTTVITVTQRSKTELSCNDSFVEMELSSETIESNFSLELFDFLSKIVGSEKDVRARRIFFKVLDHALQYSPQWRVVTSGSKSEGLDLPGSDLDIMYINQVDSVYNAKSEVPSDLPYALYFDFENTPPGYVHIKLHQNNKRGMHTQHMYSDNMLLANGHYKRLIQSMYIDKNIYNESMFFTEIHGPCSSSICGSYDFLSTYECHSWPRNAAEWITRPRSYQWPQTELIEDIVRDNVLLAPIGSKSNKKKEDPYEWRMSFSIAEKMLIHSFNHTQILCYALLKYTLKEVIHRKIKGTMCSYFMKTLLFWMIEESHIYQWQPNRLFECFQACIKRLMFFVQNNVLPNYFIPHNNLIEGKIDVQKKTSLLSILQTFVTNGTHSLRQIQTFSSLFDNREAPLSSELFSSKYSNVDSTIYPILHYMHGIGFGGSNTIYQPIYCIMAHRKCKLLKHICFIWFSKLCGSLLKHYSFMICQDNKETLQNQKCNKMFFSDYKKCLWYSVLGSFSDSYTGWLLLAEFFFQFKQHEKALQILQLCSIKSSNNHQIINPNLKPSQRNKILQKIGKTFVQRYKHSCSDLFYLTPKAKPHLMFYHEDVPFPGPDRDIIIVNPQIRMYYLHFLCHNYLGNNTEKWKALRLLNEFTLQCTSSKEYTNSLMHLLDASLVANTIQSFALTDVFHHNCKLQFMYKEFCFKHLKPCIRAATNMTREERDSLPPLLKKSLSFVSDLLNI